MSVVRINGCLSLGKRLKTGFKKEIYRRAKRAERWPREGERVLFPLQTTSRLADFFPFSPNVEPGSRLRVSVLSGLNLGKM